MALILLRIPASMIIEKGLTLVPAHFTSGVCAIFAV
jgi:hypothetical protein